MVGARNGVALHAALTERRQPVGAHVSGCVVAAAAVRPHHHAEAQQVKLWGASKSFAMVVPEAE